MGLMPDCLVTDTDMPLRSRRAESHELGTLVDTLKAKARRLIGPRLRVILGSSDLTQEALLVAVRKFAMISGRPRREVLGWLYGIMRMRILSYARKYRAELESEAIEHMETVAVEGGAHSGLDRLVRDEVRRVLVDAIAGLREEERLVVVGLYQEGRSTKDLAAALGRTEGAIRAIQQRALKRLRGRLGRGIP
jgi:RNA polymerase sigma-70 factor (ECF subfamily)